MAWRVFSVVAGLSVWWAVGMGVTNELSTKSNPIVGIIGGFGALIAGIAVGSYINDLPLARRRLGGGASMPPAACRMLGRGRHSQDVVGSGD